MTLDPGPANLGSWQLLEDVNDAETAYAYEHYIKVTQDEPGSESNTKVITSNNHVKVVGKLPVFGIQIGLTSLDQFSAVGRFDGGGTGLVESIGSNVGTPQGSQIAAMMQPFFAPGILYNTIKSGIAVDWPMMTGSLTKRTHEQTTAQSGYLKKNPITGELFNWRMPFEALVDPQSYLPLSESDGSKKMSFIWHKSGSIPKGPWWDYHGINDNKYAMAMQNFLGEIPRFFLKNENFKTFVSAPESKFKPMTSGTLYQMDVILKQTHDFIMCEGPRRFQITADGTTAAHPILWDARGAVYGPPCKFVESDSTDATGKIHPGTATRANGFINTYDPAFAPFTPPHFYQDAIARITFAPHSASIMDPLERKVFTLDEILANSKMETTYHGSGYATADTENTPGFQNRLDIVEASRTVKRGRRSGAGQHVAEYLTHATDNDLAAGKYRMKLSSSINLFGKSRLKPVQYEARFGRTLDLEFTPISTTDTGDSSFDIWTISPKFECPTLNFSGSSVRSLETAKSYNGESYNSATSLGVVDDASLSASIGTRGMWGGYGEVPNAHAGLWLELQEALPDRHKQPMKLDIVDSTRDPVNVEGLVPGTAFDSLIDVCGFRSRKERIGELADEKWISEAIVAVPFVIRDGKRNFFTIDRDLFVQAMAPIAPTPAPGQAPGNSIKEMVAKLKNYYLPPHMDFINNPTMEAFVIYVFEFAHKLDRKDLSDIWQNLMPKIAKNAEEQEVIVCHDLGPNEFFGGYKIPSDTQWMVFKIKKRAEKSYYKVTADTQDDSRFAFQFKTGGVKRVPEYNYNWPYDFFSLVELAKIEAEVEFDPAKSLAYIDKPIPFTGQGELFTAAQEIERRREKQAQIMAQIAAGNQQAAIELMAAPSAASAAAAMEIPGVGPVGGPAGPGVGPVGGPAGPGAGPVGGPTGGGGLGGGGGYIP